MAQCEAKRPARKPAPCSDCNEARLPAGCSINARGIRRQVLTIGRDRDSLAAEIELEKLITAET
jgi:hypothetical protein